MNGVSHVTPELNLHEVTHKRMDTKATVRFSKGDGSVTQYCDLQTPGHTSNKYKNIHQVPQANVRPFKGSSFAGSVEGTRAVQHQVLVTPQRLWAQVQGEAQDEEVADCPSLACLTMSCFWLWSRVGCTDSIQPLGYSSKVEMAHR